MARVKIRAYRSPRQNFSDRVAAEGGPAEQYLPAKYNTKSELTATVDSSTEGSTHHFDLKSR